MVVIYCIIIDGLFTSDFLSSYMVWITFVFPGLPSLLDYIMLYVFDMDFVYIQFPVVVVVLSFCSGGIVKQLLCRLTMINII
jgi:hypothetical protein